MPAGVSAYVPLANITLSSTATSVTFSSINQSYKDLVLVSTFNLTAGFFSFRFNGSTANIYSWVFMNGNGSSPSSSSFANQSYMFDAPNPTAEGMFISNLMDYSSTNQKTVLLRRDVASIGTFAGVASWRSASAVTSFQVFCSSGNFTVGSTFALYGVSA
jgi:hypothetical protein